MLLLPSGKMVRDVRQSLYLGIPPVDITVLTSDEEKRILPSFLLRPPTVALLLLPLELREGGVVGKRREEPSPGGGKGEREEGGAGGGGGREKRRRRRNFAWTQKAPFSSSQRSLVASHCRKGGDFSCGRVCNGEL